MFFVGDNLLPVDAPINHFHQENQVVLALDNQNNAILGETVSHFKSDFTEACLVQSGVNIFLCLKELSCNPITHVSNFPISQGLRSVSASNIIAVIWSETQLMGAARL